VLAVVALRPGLDLFSNPDQADGGAALDPVSALGLAFVGIAVIWLLTQRLSGRWLRSSFAVRSILFFIFIAILSVGYSYDRASAVQSIVRLLGGMVMFVVLEQLLGRDLGFRARRGCGAVLASAVMPVAIGWHQLLTGPPVDKFGDVRVLGPFVHSNTFATFFVSVTLVALGTAKTFRHRTLKLVVGIVPVLTVPLLIGTGGRTAWVALLLGVLVLNYRRLIWLGPLNALGVFAAVMFVPAVQERIDELSQDKFDDDSGLAENSLSWRMTYWGMLIDMTAERPLTGWGWDQFAVMPTEVTQFPEEFTNPPHNAFVRAYAELGVIGLGTLLAIITGVIAAMWRRAREASCAPLPAQQALKAFQITGVAVLVAIGLQMLSENILTAPVSHWMVAASATWGLGGGINHSAPRSSDGQI